MQTPNPKSQIPKTSQVPNPNWKHSIYGGRFFGIWSLGFGWDLGFGIWDLGRPRSQELPDSILVRRFRAAFTLIELILVMTVLTIAVSITAPALANFFRGRSLDSEARRLLALTREGQSRAVSEGLPMDLWLDAQQGAYGLEAEASYEVNDPKAVNFNLDRDMQLEVGSLNQVTSGVASGIGTSTGAAGASKSQSIHSGLPHIGFLPDGSLSQDSPQKLRLTGRDGISIWVALSRNRLNYEIQSRGN